MLCLCYDQSEFMAFFIVFNLLIGSGSVVEFYS